jgi:hypothetical protein
MMPRVMTLTAAILIMTQADPPAFAQHGVMIPDSPASTTNYSSTPLPNYSGLSDFGAAQRGADGRLCVTTPALIGKPQYGTVTTCYSDPTRAEPTGQSMWLDSETAGAEGNAR